MGEGKGGPILEFVFADVNGGGRVYDVGGEVVDHCSGFWLSKVQWEGRELVKGHGIKALLWGDNTKESTQ